MQQERTAGRALRRHNVPSLKFVQNRCCTPGMGSLFASFAAIITDLSGFSLLTANKENRQSSQIVLAAAMAPPGVSHIQFRARNRYAWATGTSNAEHMRQQDPPAESWKYRTSGRRYNLSPAIREQCFHHFVT